MLIWQTCQGHTEAGTNALVVPYSVDDYHAGFLLSISHINMNPNRCCGDTPHALPVCSLLVPSQKVQKENNRHGGDHERRRMHAARHPCAGGCKSSLAPGALRRQERIVAHARIHRIVHRPRLRRVRERTCPHRIWNDERTAPIQIPRLAIPAHAARAALARVRDVGTPGYVGVEHGAPGDAVFGRHAAEVVRGPVGVHCRGEGVEGGNLDGGAAAAGSGGIVVEEEVAGGIGVASARGDDGSEAGVEAGLSLDSFDGGRIIIGGCRHRRIGRTVGIICGRIGGISDGTIITSHRKSLRDATNAIVERHLHDRRRIAPQIPPPPHQLRNGAKRDIALAPVRRAARAPRTPPARESILVGAATVRSGVPPPVEEVSRGDVQDGAGRGRDGDGLGGGSEAPASGAEGGCAGGR